MQLFASLLFGISASLDALLLGITYGARNIRVSLWQNLFLSFITLLGTCFSVGLGGSLNPLFPSSLGKWIGSLTLVLLGLYYLIKCMILSLKKYRCLRQCKSSAEPAHPNDCECPPSDRPAPATLKNAFALGLALSVNNMGIGLGASMAGLSFIPAAVSTLVFSAVFLALGNHLGCGRLCRFLGNAADPLSGFLLLLLGMWELFV